MRRAVPFPALWLSLLGTVLLGPTGAARAGALGTSGAAEAVRTPGGPEQPTARASLPPQRALKASVESLGQLVGLPASRPLGLTAGVVTALVDAPTTPEAIPTWPRTLFPTGPPSPSLS